MNLENLRIAVEGIEKMNIREDQFDISSYGGIRSCTKKQVKNNDCNTTACFLGWFPFVKGLEPVDSDYFEDGFSYSSYCWRILNIGVLNIEWEFLFDSNWKYYDNTLQGALKRAKYLLDGNDIGGFKHEDFEEGCNYKK